MNRTDFEYKQELEAKIVELEAENKTLQSENVKLRFKPGLTSDRKPCKFSDDVNGIFDEIYGLKIYTGFDIMAIFSEHDTFLINEITVDALEFFNTLVVELGRAKAFYADSEFVQASAKIKEIKADIESFLEEAIP